MEINDQQDTQLQLELSNHKMILVKLLLSHTHTHNTLTKPVIQYICTELCEYADVVVVLIVWRYMCIVLCMFDK